MILSSFRCSAQLIKELILVVDSVATKSLI
jgi:hypothetical protein